MNPNWVCTKCTKPFGSLYAPKKCDKCGSPVKPYVPVAAQGKEEDYDNEWANLCQEKRLKPTVVGNVQAAVDADAGKNGLPVKDTLGKMVGVAEKLKVKPPKNRDSGIYFHICVFTAKGKRGKQLKNTLVNEKKGSSICYENTFLPLSTWSQSDGCLLVHQTVAPCLRCCSGSARH